MIESGIQDSGMQSETQTAANIGATVKMKDTMNA